MNKVQGEETAFSYYRTELEKINPFGNYHGNN